MNTLIAVSIAPFGVGDELSQYVAEVVKVIEASGVMPHDLHVYGNRRRLGRSYAGCERRNIRACKQGHPHKCRDESRYSPRSHKSSDRQSRKTRQYFGREKRADSGWFPRCGICESVIFQHSLRRLWQPIRLYKCGLLAYFSSAIHVGIPIDTFFTHSWECYGKTAKTLEKSE